MLPPPNNDCPTSCGSRDTIPTKIMIDTPLPMPFSVISSPSHTRKIVPAVMEMIIASEGSQLGR